MEKHGSETFFVLGEGLLGETVGGREPRLAADAVTSASSSTTISPSIRPPSLDLDSLYGAGPQDPDSAKFYEADGRMSQDNVEVKAQHRAEMEREAGAAGMIASGRVCDHELRSLAERPHRRLKQRSLPQRQAEPRARRRRGPREEA